MPSTRKTTSQAASAAGMMISLPLTLEDMRSFQNDSVELKMNNSAAPYTVPLSSYSSDCGKDASAWPDREPVGEKHSGHNLSGLLDDLARERPEQIALIEGVGSAKRSICYRHLHASVCAKASALQKQSLREGDTVLLIEPLSIELYTTILAILRIGAVVLLVDPAQGLMGLERALALVKPRAFVAA